MLSWQIWLIIAGFCFVLEIVTVGFLVFWFGVAALIVCILSLVVPNVITQSAIFLVLSAILVFFTRPLSKKLGRTDTTVTNAERLIGKTAVVKKTITSHSSGQVKVQGELWTAALPDDETNDISEDSEVKIVAIDGVKLIVKPTKVVAKK